MQNKVISLVAMRSNELSLVQENHATVKPGSSNSSVSPRGIELRNLQILKKMLEKSSQFLSSEQPCEPKSLDVALHIAGVEKILSENMWLKSTRRPFDSSFEREELFTTVAIVVFCGWWFLNQFDIMSETHFSCDIVGRELWLAIVSSLLCPEMDWNTRTAGKVRLCVYFNWS